jgi:3-ketosteroid 9alpha-monooxygenase subunit B
VLAGISPYHRLRVAALVDETADAKSIIFATPQDAGAFDYRPGQFLTLRVPVDGTVVRCYSLASTPQRGEAMKVTVKRVRDGRASNWLCEHLKAGDDLEVMPPAGVFTPRQLDADFLLFAGGSGITPVLSILKAALHQGQGQVVLVYANRDEHSVIFAQELAELARSHPQRLVVHHWLETIQGRPTVEQIAALARPHRAAEAFVCGPEPYMDCVATALSGLDMPRQRVHVERFVSLSSDPGAERAAPAAFTATGPDTALEVRLDGQTRKVDWQRDVTLLDAMLAAKLDVPFSCREGKCSACVCKVVDGEVTMVENHVLNAQDLADRYVLACQAIPDTARVCVSFDE